MSLINLTDTEVETDEQNLAIDWLSNANNATYDDWEHILKCQIERQMTGNSTFIDTAKDNNCFFRCISIAMTGIPDYHYQLRLSATSYMERNEKYFRKYGGNALLDNEDYQQKVANFVEQQAKLGIQADETAIICKFYFSM